jgi:hypothetical protein
MAVVGIQIVEPEHDAAFIGSGSVTLRGSITDKPAELKNVALYYRWYSSLYVAEKDHYAIDDNVQSHPGTSFSPTLGLGSQAITLAATDRPFETDADLEAVQHGGMTGGSEGDAPCVIHVFIANLIELLDGDTLNRASSTLQAEAPGLWGKEADTPSGFELNDDYHALNRLQYRWEFVPTGPPAGRATIDFIPDIEQYMFDPITDQTTPRIRYEGALPAALTAAYTLNLHVEDIDGILGGDQTGVNVMVTP